MVLSPFLLLVAQGIDRDEDLVLYKEEFRILSIDYVLTPIYALGYQQKERG